MTDPTTATAIKLKIAQIFLEEAQFAHQGDALLLSPGQKVPASAQVTIDLRVTGDGKGAAVRLRVVTEPSEAVEAPYSFSVAYVVLFTFEGTMTEELQESMMVTGATMAMPFVREIVANLTGRARGGPVWLSPINFSEMVRKQKTESAAATP